VGQQVRQLEALIGAPLFERVGRRLRLTDRGAAALAPLKRGFELVGEASAALREPRSAQSLTLAAPPDILTGWLAADIAAWTGPADIVLKALSGSAAPTAAFEAGADIVLDCASDTPAGAVSLMEEVLAPLRAPQLALEGDGLAQLDGARLIEDGSAQAGWAQWASARGAYGLDLEAEIRAPDTLTALALAEAGAGVVLARKPLAFDAIRAGRLAPVFPDGDMAVNAHYHLMEAPGRAPSPAAQRLSAHIKARAAARQDLATEL
jgi:DNA-binding transcriptional LysR family regulator